MGQIPTKTTNDNAATTATPAGRLEPRDAIFHELGVRSSVLAAYFGGDTDLVEAFRRSAVAHYLDTLNASDRERDKIASVNVASYVGACMVAAVDGLTPDGIDGWILIRKGGIASWTQSYRGAVKLALRAADLRGLVAEVVYREEIAAGGFRCDVATQEIAHAQWYMFDEIPVEPDENSIALVYAAAEVKIGGEWRRQFRVLSARALDQRARLSGSPFDDIPSNVWTTWYREQARAKAIGALMDTLPKPDHVWQAIQAARKSGRARQVPGAPLPSLSVSPAAALAGRVRSIGSTLDATAREADAPADPNDPHGAHACERGEADAAARAVEQGDA